MAEVKKTTEKKVEAEVKEEKMVTINIPRTSSKEETDLYVSVNDRSWLIKKGVNVEVPEEVAILLERRQRLMREALEYSESKELPDNLK